MEHPHYYTGSHVQQGDVKDHLGHWRTDQERQRLKAQAAEAHFQKREAEKEEYRKMREKLAAETARRTKIGWDTPQVFECVIPHPGVGYRNSVDFNDKVTDLGCGPVGAVRCCGWRAVLWSLLLCCGWHAVLWLACCAVAW
jgi:hypothetical protein